MFPSRPFSLQCPRCEAGTLVLDASALDTGCQGKHVFFFECDQCKGFQATAMNNIPVEEWHQFIPASDLERMISNYRAASGKG